MAKVCILCCWRGSHGLFTESSPHVITTCGINRRRFALCTAVFVLLPVNLPQVDERRVKLVQGDGGRLQHVFLQRVVVAFSLPSASYVDAHGGQAEESQHGRHNSQHGRTWVLVRQVQGKGNATCRHIDT